MIDLRVLIIGYGSIGQRHYKILSSLRKIKDIKIITSLNLSKTKKINLKKSEILTFNPDYILICSETSKHFKQLKFINNLLKDKLILVEKPLFNTYQKIGKVNNKIFVGYNFRFHPLIKFLKDYVLNDKNDAIISINVYAGSYLPLWRKNRIYSSTYSSNKNKGGGVEYDLSHELDYIKWIFGKFKIYFKFNKKISNLNINSNDHLTLVGYFKKNKIINLHLNYYSKIAYRKLIADFNKKTVHLDLINNSLIIKHLGSKKNINRKIINFDRDITFKKQHLSIINYKYKDLCSYKDALEDINLIT